MSIKDVLNDQNELAEPTLRAFPRGMVRKFSFVSERPPTAWEYVYVPVGAGAMRFREELTLAVFEHNLDWEAAPFTIFSDDDPVHPVLERVLRRFPEDVAVRFLPRYIDDDGASACSAYAPLLHLLPGRLRQKHGLPCRHAGQWPTHMVYFSERVPADFRRRLGAAFAEYLWPFIFKQSPMGAFDRHEPLRIFAHGLDFWMPHVDAIIRDIAGTFGRVSDDEAPGDLELCRASMGSGLKAEWPLRGGTIWYGEDEAAEVTKAMIERADADGRLRAIFDAIRSHRVEDDFSPRWSRAKEDFERKLYSKRSKVKVTFVELPDTLPVHGPDTEVEENVLWQDFFSLLSPTERRVVVCLRSGTSKGVDVAKELGYANHSPVSKALARIRKKAMDYLA